MVLNLLNICRFYPNLSFVEGQINGICPNHCQLKKMIFTTLLSISIVVKLKLYIFLYKIII